ncbi:hypothetical protein [Limnoglobus roseus]|uniref:histidine kinase n=1 Tax=Limnoglobus roseus TaxID=2598579 RepID=A0A5C1ASU4_9BACT|nr:hypothetical protein [Limnoglobus roseus]QEL21106.1 PAS domain S-box protein [Limnoglobus roseus]
MASPSPIDVPDPDKLSSLGHDLNNLLTVIGGYAVLLAEIAPPGEPLIYAAEIEKTSRDAALIVREMMATIRPRREES